MTSHDNTRCHTTPHDTTRRHMVSQYIHTTSHDNVPGITLCEGCYNVACCREQGHRAMAGGMLASACYRKGTRLQNTSRAFYSLRIRNTWSLISICNCSACGKKRLWVADCAPSYYIKRNIFALAQHNYGSTEVFSLGSMARCRTRK